MHYSEYSYYSYITTMEQKLKIKITLAVVCLSLVVFGYGFKQQQKNVYPIRVAILDDAKSFTIATSGKYNISDALTGQTLLEGRRLRTKKVRSTDKGLFLAETGESFPQDAWKQLGSK